MSEEENKPRGSIFSRLVQRFNNDETPLPVRPARDQSRSPNKEDYPGGFVPPGGPAEPAPTTDREAERMIKRRQQPGTTILDPAKTGEAGSHDEGYGRNPGDPEASSTNRTAYLEERPGESLEDRLKRLVDKGSRKRFPDVHSVVGGGGGGSGNDNWDSSVEFTPLGKNMRGEKVTNMDPLTGKTELVEDEHGPPNAELDDSNAFPNEPHFTKIRLIPNEKGPSDPI